MNHCTISLIFGDCLAMFACRFIGLLIYSRDLHRQAIKRKQRYSAPTTALALLSNDQEDSAKKRSEEVKL
jgi:hypothetical protein